MLSQKSLKLKFSYFQSVSYFRRAVLFFCWSIVLFQKQSREEKKMLLKILQNSQENTCAGTSFLIKWQAYACNFI